MYVYCNFYCSPAKKHGSGPHFSGAGDATECLNTILGRLLFIINLFEKSISE